MKWSDEEIQIIKSFDKKDELIKLLPNRNWDSIRKIRSKIVPENVVCKNIQRT